MSKTMTTNETPERREYTVVETTMTEFKYATDSETGTIEASSFAEACEELDAMVTPKAIKDGGWGWVKDTDGSRYEIGNR